MSPTELMEAIAVKTTEENSSGSPKMNASAAMAHTVLMGVCVRLLTTLQTRHRGTPLSLDRLHNTLNTRYNFQGQLQAGLDVTCHPPW